MKRIGQIIRIRPECVEEYKRLHANIWPEVARIISDCKIRNYSIYLLHGQLFAYLEYVGTDYEGDMAKMAASEVMQEWWAVCKPLQIPDPDRPEGAWWWDAEEVFHQD